MHYWRFKFVGSCSRGRGCSKRALEFNSKLTCLPSAPSRDAWCATLRVGVSTVLVVAVAVVGTVLRQELHKCSEFFTGVEAQVCTCFGGGGVAALELACFFRVLLVRATVAVVFFFAVSRFLRRFFFVRGWLMLAGGSL